MARGFSPLDEELHLLPGEFSPTVVESMVRLGAWMPFRPGSAMIDHFTKVKVSEATVRRNTEGAGGAYVEVQAAEVEALKREMPESPEGPALQQISVDGAMVPLVGGRWAEVKTLAIGTVKREVVGQATGFAGARSGGLEVRTEELSYFSRMADHESFGQQALVEIYRRGTEKAGTVCGVNDGAEWEQGFLDYHRPDAVRILDWGHSSEYIAKAGQAVYGLGTAETSEWVGEQLHELKTGDPDKVLAALRGLEKEVDERVEVGRREEVLKVVTGSLEYLEKRREQIAYAEFLRAGYPIGSGVVESANKLVVEARLKGSGMHWADEQVDPMLALRNVVCSDRWEEAWGQISQRLGQQARERKTALRAERQGRKAETASEVASGEPVREAAVALSAAETQASPQTVKKSTTTGTGSRRPGKDHPWRHMLIGRPR
ncbi:MAG: ISKra4 family transposase [Chloroflexota bacterium]